ncbi:MAG: DUF4159 domain-containing protein [Elusimicrobiota bacterium]|nr:DUF4159 domain-containing protein [Elusimicrobiota bacterium]
MAHKKLGSLLVIGMVFCSLIASPLPAQQRDRFVFSQLRYKGADWDPYPTAYKEILHYLTTTTSVRAQTARRELSLSDAELFLSPFLYMSGKEEFAPFTAQEIENLRRYLSCGGLLLIDDASGGRDLGFNRAVLREMEKLFPEGKLKRLLPDHAVFRSFYLSPSVVGRRVGSPYLEGIDIDGQTVVIYSRNDLGGTWVRDRLGNWLYECVPGGELQRLEAMKLFLNIVIYSLTGTYKRDAVHQPYIQQKLKIRKTAP